MGIVDCPVGSHRHSGGRGILGRENIATHPTDIGASVALLYGKASLEEYAPGVSERPEVKDMMARVHSVTDPVLDAAFPHQWPAWAEVDTRDGRTLRSEIVYPKGDPENALSWDEMKQKFMGLSSPVISDLQQQDIIAAVEDLENMTDVRRLASLLMAS